MRLIRELTMAIVYWDYEESLGGGCRFIRFETQVQLVAFQLGVTGTCGNELEYDTATDMYRWPYGADRKWRPFASPAHAARALYDS